MAGEKEVIIYSGNILNKAISLPKVGTEGGANDDELFESLKQVLTTKREKDGEGEPWANGNPLEIRSAEGDTGSGGHQESQGQGQGDRADLKVTAKLFLYSLERKDILAAFEKGLECTGVSYLDNIVLSFSRRGELTLEEIELAWVILEELIADGKVKVLGLSDVDTDIFISFYGKAKVKPGIVQVNLASCCVVPPELQEFCKLNGIQLLTHKDKLDVLSESQAGDLGKLVNGAGAEEVSGLSWVSSWVIRFQVHLKTSGLPVTKGYVASLSSKAIPREMLAAKWMGVLGPFPEELWLSILDKLAHSEDILSVLKAFPALDNSVQNKKAHWLFDQVLPHLMTKHLVIKSVGGGKEDFVKSKQLLKLRLISKRWKNAVDLAIQHHAGRHPINTGSENGKHSEVVGLPFNHFNYNNNINKYHLGATLLQNFEQINDFQTEMANHEGNPFPGKYTVFITDHDFDPSFDPEDTLPRFVMKAMELLQNFGQHITALEFQLGDDDECHLELCKAILKGLAAVPNLQFLEVWGYLDGPTSATNAFFSEPENLALFPKLDKLECFDWKVFMERPHDRSVWVDHMIDFYGGRGGERKGLGTLSLYHHDWNVGMATNLKNLTSLGLQFMVPTGDPIDHIRDVLRMFPKRQLKKFWLGYHPRVRFICIDELIEMLDEFQIENIEFEALKWKERGSGVCAAGITSLHLGDGEGLSYEFLKRLPNLRFLSIFSNARQFIGGVPVVRNYEQGSFASHVRQYFWTADKDYEWKGDCTFDIWKECGKLEILTGSLLKGFSYPEVQFVREYGNKPFWGLSGGAIEESSEEEEEEEEEN